MSSEFKVFYYDIEKDESIAAETAQPMTLKTAYDIAKNVMKSHENFIGFLDEEGVVLQFAPEEENKVWVEIPEPDRVGSYQTKLSNEEALSLIRNLKSPLLRYREELKMRFSRW